MAELALVTGGARRIGAGIVEALADAGYRIAIHCGRSRGEAQELAARLTQRGATAQVFAADLVDPAAVDALVPAVVQAMGPIGLLVNNAASFHVDDLLSLDVPSWNRQFSINLRAPSMLAAAFARQLPEGREGAIVNILDQRVWNPSPRCYSYALTKAALLEATKVMAQTLAPRIRVNGVGPGPTLPNRHDGADAMQREAAGVPLERSVEPAEIAQAVLYLARAGAVTGQMIAVDAGQHLGWRTPDVV